LALAAQGALVAPAAGNDSDVPPSLPELSPPPPCTATDTAIACPLDELPAGTRIVRLSADAVYDVGRSLSAANEAQIARIDSLYRAGTFGDTGSDAARQSAHLMARLSTANAYAYIVRFATDTTCVYEADEEALRHAFASFSDPGLYPITRLRRARMGMGAVCLQYDLRGDLDTLATMGERRVRVRVRDLDVAGERGRMLSMMLPTGLDDVVEVLMSEHYHCRIEHVDEHADSGPFELYLLHDMEGFLLRKWGTHRPRALMFWTIPDAAARTALPSDPQVGVRLYVPHLTLKLRLLPDVGFDDLRAIDLPQPILRLDYVHGEAHPEWLRSVKTGGFDGWAGYGSVPHPLRQRFPDL
jgi:hypothetical protein